MIANDTELKVTLERIARFQEQVAHLRRVETNPENYHGAVSGFLAEIDRMQLEVREYPEHSPRRSGINQYLVDHERLTNGLRLALSESRNSALAFARPQTVVRTGRRMSRYPVMQTRATALEINRER